jgi:hypothetical protein
MNWKGRMAWNIVDIPWSLGLRRTSQSMASLLGLSPEIAGKSWRGASLDVPTVRNAVREAGGELLEVTGEGTPMTWCCGVKAAKRNAIDSPGFGTDHRSENHEVMKKL